MTSLSPYSLKSFIASVPGKLTLVIHIALICAICTTIPEIPLLAADFSSLTGKHVAGYQGWFACPSDPVDPRWSHWFQGGKPPGPQTLGVDLWPDLSELDPTDLCPTGMTLRSGAPAYVFSSERTAAVRRHFQWMKDYGVDGVAVQRFLSQIANPHFLARLNLVLSNIRTAAEAEDRGFFVMYDVSGLSNNQDVALVERDWAELQESKIIWSSSYMHHGGKPVVGLWGLGISDRNASADLAATIINFFKDDAKVTVLGGVAAHWRTLEGDSHKEAEWAGVYRSFDILSPWTVGRFRNPDEADAFARVFMAADIKETRDRRQDYMPVIFPGFSWHNLRYGAAPLDQIPRLCGTFYMEQATNAIRLGATMLYTAMFDEIDEGTAIFKLVENPSQLPTGAELLIPGADTCKGKNDLYLKIAGEITRELRRQTQRK